MKSIAAIALTLFVAAGSHAGIIYQQTPNAGSSGYLSSTTTPGGSNLEELVWDGFSSPTTVTLREIQWRGVRTNAPVDFQISINTIAIPGGTVWHTNGSASETPTGTPGVYNYKFTLPSGFVLTGGQGYWLQIVGMQSGWPEWQWSAATGGNGSHYAQVPAITGDYRFILAGGDVAFTLLDQATVPVTINLMALPASGGTMSGGGTFQGGTNVTMTATPNAGRNFLNWTENGVVVSTNASFTFAADGNKTLTANFSGPSTGPYLINATANPAAYGNTGGGGAYHNAGEIVDLDVTPQDGLSFVGWTENGDLVNLPFNGGVFQVTANADRNLVANFAYPAYTSFINGVVSPTGSGSLIIAGTAGLSSGSYLGGTMLTFNATAYPGYHFAYWKQGAGLGDVSGAPHVVGTSSPTLKHMACYGTTITAFFEPDFPVLTLSGSPVAGGTTSGAGSYAHNSNVTVNATPTVGYVFSSWKQGATVMSTNASYTFALKNHTTLTAFFTAQNRTITASASPAAGGRVTGAGVVGNGASVTLAATPNAGYAFDSWTLDGAAAGNTNPLVFNANANHTFVANFIAVPSYTISASASPSQGGSVSGAGVYQAGNNTTLIAVANPGYYFVNWTEDAAEASTLANYGFTVNASRALVANFATVPVITPVAPVAPGAGFTFAWPAALTGWALEESSDLNPGSWVPCAETITTSAGQNSITVTAPTDRRFFRLVRH